MIITVFVAIVCIYTAAKIMSVDERTTVFNKKKIQVKDVKKYNKACAGLVLGFGVAAEIPLVVMGWFGAKIWLSVAMVVLLIVEAVVVTKIYAKIEKNLIKQYDEKD